MNRNSPEIYKQKHQHKLNVVNREKEYDQVVRYALSKAVAGVESVGREGSRVLVSMVQLVDILIHHRMMKRAMKAVHGKVRYSEEDHRRNRNPPPPTRFFRDFIVHFAVPAVNRNRRRHHQRGHERNRGESDEHLMLDLLPELTLVIWIYGFREVGMFPKSKKDGVGDEPEQEVEEATAQPQDEPIHEHLVRKLFGIYKWHRLYKQVKRYFHWMVVELGKQIMIIKKYFCTERMLTKKKEVV